MLIKVAITDDHPMMVEGLVHALSGRFHIEVVATYGSGTDLMKGLAINQPDILLLDLQLPDCMGNELAVKIRKQHPGVRIIILTGMESSFHAKDILQQGCMGYLYKLNTNSEILVQAIEQVFAGEVFIDPEVKNQLVNNIIRKEPSSTARVQLSKREREILQLITTSYTSPQIAQKLFISLRTVENHRFSLMQKLGVKNAAGLVLKAVQMGIVE